MKDQLIKQSTIDALRELADMPPAPPTRLMTAQEVEDARETKPQIIQRVKGAKYILDLDGELTPSAFVEGVCQQLNEWWNTDEPFLVLRYPVSLSVIVLPEAPFWVEDE